MIPYSENMHQAATYWPPAGNDGFGGVAKGKPEAICCRWQNKAVMFRSQEGREQVSQAIVYSPTRCAVGGFLYLGTTDAKTPPAGSYEVRQVDSSPNLDGTVELHKAYI